MEHPPEHQKTYPSLEAPAVHPSQMQAGSYPQSGDYPQSFYPQQSSVPITQQPTTTVIIQRANYGVGPQAMICPSCRANIATKVTYEASTKTFLFAGLLCLLFCPFAVIPFCVDSCQTANHSCPNCGNFLGCQP